MSDTWLFTEDRVWPEQVPWKESLFSIANGHLGTRGTFEEGYGDSVPATFMHGLFVTPPGDLPYLAPLPDWTGVSITVDGVRFRLDDRIPLGYERVLDLRTGVLTRRVLWRGPGTGVIRAEFRRLLSMASPGLAAMEVKVTALTEDVQVGVETGLDGSITGPYGAPWTRVEWTRTGPDRLRMRAQSDDRQASVTATSVIRGLGPLGVTHHARHPRLSATIDLAPGEWLGFTKYTSYQRANEGEEIPDDDFDQVAAASAAEWSRRWETSQIEVSGDTYAEQALRFAAFHLIGGAPRSSEGAGVGARLLSGYGYRHHVFWDTDIFAMPYLTMTQPDLARAHLGYRYRGLDGARRKAARYGRAGAFFAWESAGTGDEVTPDWGETADGERVRIRTGEIEEHIVADVAYAVDHYVRWTDDREFLAEQGAEMTLDGARYWQDRAEVDREGRAHLRNVIGPDEYHVGVDDNFFTNAMAAWHLRTAVDHGSRTRRPGLESRAPRRLGGSLPRLWPRSSSPGPVTTGSSSSTTATSSSRKSTSPVSSRDWRRSMPSSGRSGWSGARSPNRPTWSWVWSSSTPCRHGSWSRPTSTTTARGPTTDPRSAWPCTRSPPRSRCDPTRPMTTSAGPPPSISKTRCRTRITGSTPPPRAGCCRRRSSGSAVFI